MDVIASRSKSRFGLRSVGLLVVLLAVISLLACIAAIPIAVVYFQTDENYVAEADTRKSADEMWAVIVRLADEAEREGRAEILNRDEKEYLLEATDGVQNAEIKVIPRGRRKSRVTVVATVPKEEEKRKEEADELAARIMKRLCEEAKAGCKLVEK